MPMEAHASTTYDIAPPAYAPLLRRAERLLLLARRLVSDGRIDGLTSAHVEIRRPLATGATARAWHFDASIAGAGLTFDVGSHAVDLLDCFAGPIRRVGAFATNTGGAY